MLDEKKVSVLHLAPHAGGGVGTVLRAILKVSSGQSCFSHTLAVLESLNESTKEWCTKNGIGFIENGWHVKEKLLQEMHFSDIVHIHWWNHPLLQALLAFSDLPLMRSVLWSHVNGLFVPQNFFKSLVDFPDFFVLATPLSKESPLIAGSNKDRKGRVRVIQSNAGIPAGLSANLGKPEIFHAGYVGTVDYSKMHKDLISIWDETSITETPLIVCGGPSETAFSREVSARNLAHLFDVRGTVNDVSDVFADLHVLVYPLNNTHYGTGEQVIIEAMAFGAVPVVMNNGCEKFLVQDGETGIVAIGKDEFVNAIKFLKENPSKRKRMAEKGREYVLANFGIEKTIRQWHDLYEELLALGKREHHLKLRSYDNLPDNSATTLMLNSYGDSDVAGKILSLFDLGAGGEEENFSDIPPACFSITRGSPFHYQSLLPCDPCLHHICNSLELARKQYV